MKEGEPATKQDEGLPEYVLRFHAPIVLHNLLPYPVTVTLTDARSSKSGGVSAQVGSWNIGVGGSEDVYFFDLTKKLKMGLEMQVSFFSSLFQSRPSPHPPPVLCRPPSLDHMFTHPVHQCKQASCLWGMLIQSWHLAAVCCQILNASKFEGCTSMSPHGNIDPW